MFFIIRCVHVWETFKVFPNVNAKHPTPKNTEGGITTMKPP